MKKSFAQLMAEERRLDILRLLQKAPGKAANHLVLHQLLVDGPHRASRDMVAADLGYLAELGLVALEDLEGVLIGTLTGRGDDAANGFVNVPGVKNPVYGE